MQQLTDDITVLREDAEPNSGDYVIHLGTKYGPINLSVWRDPEQLDDNDSLSSKIIIMTIGSPAGHPPVATTQPFVVNGIPYVLSDALFVGYKRLYWEQEHRSAVDRLKPDGCSIWRERSIARGEAIDRAIARGEGYEDADVDEDPEVVKADEVAAQTARDLIHAIHAAIQSRWYILAEERRRVRIRKARIATAKRTIRNEGAKLLELTPGASYTDALNALMGKLADIEKTG